MVGHGAKFVQKMELAVAALLTAKNLEEAARAAGIGTNTLRRWVKLPEFMAAYREAQSALRSRAIARLQEASGAAATTILKIMLNPEEPAGARLRAAEIVLELATKAASMEDLEARLANLERNTGQKKTSRRSPTAITLLKSPLQVEASGQQDATPWEKNGQE